LMMQSIVDMRLLKMTWARRKLLILSVDRIFSVFRMSESAALAAKRSMRRSRRRSSFDLSANPKRVRRKCHIACVPLSANFAQRALQGQQAQMTIALQS